MPCKKINTLGITICCFLTEKKYSFFANFLIVKTLKFLVNKSLKLILKFAVKLICSLKKIKKIFVFFSTLCLLIEQFFLIVVLTSNALASSSELPITADGSTNTQIQRSANDIPLVNIATPNSSGLSHNKFSDYNVNQIGLILNNAINNQSGVVLTQIGGLIIDNVNLKNSGSASIILNEVTSNNISQINGYTEIVGSKADLILANPNGFVMNGAGFINTNKLTTVVGKANQFNADASNLTFKLSNGSQIIDNQGNGFLPKLVITGGGLDLESVDYSDLVANVMNIVAPIYGGANDVNLRTGDASFNYLTKAVASDNATTLNNIPSEVAIDASNLGKIQAGKIFMIATQQGFGIKYSADLIAQRAGIVIDALGNIDYANISSTGNANQANIEITSKQGSITQNGVVQTKDLANNILINAFGEIKNYGKFLSSANVDIESKSQDFINYSLANLAKNNFTIKALNFSNLGEIAASNDLEINAQTVSNSDKLIANANLIINADQINNNNSLYSQNNLTLNANEIINNTSNSQIFALNDITIKTNSINNSDGKIEAKNNLKLQNLTLADLKPTWVFNVKEQPITIENNKGNFYAKNLLEFALGKADYSIAGDLKSDGKIKISANNITNKINLQGNGDIEIIALDTFLNGALGVDNSGTAIIANNNLSITATNLLSNYATLSAKNNLHLTSLENNINNNLNAEIIAGSRTKIKSADGKEKYLYQGLLTLDAKQGIVNQNSINSIIVNGNYSLDVADFINTGKVEVAGDLIFNITNDLTNDVKALILAGGNLEINVGNNLTNKTDAVIYSQGKLIIQKYALNNPLYNPDDNKINELTNSSGKIISYDGDMEIYAKTIENKRTIDPFNAVLDPQNKGTILNTESEKLNQYDWHYKQDGCFGNNCENTYWGYYAKQLTNANSIASLIHSNKNLFFYTQTLNNKASNILAQGNITVHANKLNNFSINDAGLYYITTSWMDDPVYSLAETRFVNFDGGNGRHPSSDLDPANYSQINTANFKSAKKIFLNVAKEIGNEKTQEDQEVSKSDERSAKLINSLNVSEIVDKGIINLDLSNYFSAQSVIGLFAKSSNPNRPLFETRSQFIDQSKFFGSDYFYQKIGLNLTNLQTQFE
ncbi:MAG: filamentous hemagglutinin N-terminal domain-containing protein, partial [Alphaproteobacteria bacterium]